MKKKKKHGIVPSCSWVASGSKTVEMKYCTLTVEFCYFISSSVCDGSPVDSYLNFKFEFVFLVLFFTGCSYFIWKNSSPEMFIKETNLAFCLSVIILGLLHGRPFFSFFFYRNGENKCQGLFLWLIKSCSFLCDRHSSPPIVFLLSLMMPPHAFETF